MISTYTNETDTESALTQNKINATLLALDTAIDTATEETTEQDFGTFKFSGSYYTGKRIDLDSAPVMTVPVLYSLANNYRILIGQLSSVGNKGYFIGTIDMSHKTEITETVYTSEKTEEYASEWEATDNPPADTDTTEEQDIYDKTEWWVDEGTKTVHTQITYDVEQETRVEDDTTEYRYAGTVSTVVYEERNYTRTIDMNRDIDIDMKYMRK